jgi:YHS domain-containing protein
MLASAVLSAAEPAAKKAEIEGYCPVAYVLAHKAVRGTAEFSSTADGKLYYFAGAQAKQAFDADPKKFRIAYDGLCATNVALGRRVKSDPTLFVLRDGLTYLFSSAEAMRAFQADPAGTIARADARWPRLK